MKILNYLFATYWFVLGACTFLGYYDPSNIEILCASITSSLFFLHFASK